MKVDKNEVNTALIYMITRNPFNLLFILIINLIAPVGFICDIEYKIAFYVFVSVVLLIDIYKIIRIFIIKHNALKSNVFEVEVHKPRARLLIRKMRGRSNVCIGWGVSGFINGRYKNLYAYPRQFSINHLKEKIDEINELDDFNCKIVKSSKLIFVFEHNEETNKNINKLHTVKIYNSFEKNIKSIKAKYPFVEFELDDIFKYLTEDGNEEELYLLNSSNKYIVFRIYGKTKENETAFFINKTEYSLESIINYLDINGFLFDNKIRVFYTYDKNSPILLYNWIVSVKK